MISISQHGDELFCMEWKEGEHVVSKIVFARNTILSFISFIPHRGYGSRLLSYFIEYMKCQGKKYIELDDMSCRYRKEHNIYRKFGFEYISNGGPEMILELTSSFVPCP